MISWVWKAIVFRNRTYIRLIILSLPFRRLRTALNTLLPVMWSITFLCSVMPERSERKKLRLEGSTI